ncbi:hypothetical protein [Marinilactibacillus psychrotolerans]|uniref:hypothetical protein n=1 Tax=Marinilactibacillus psychrotolerans TaxID=191770 RepID=UPI0038878CF1
MKLFFKSLFILNIVSFLLSILYLVFPIETVYLNGYGLLLIVTLTGNIISSVIGSQSKKADFAYLILSSAGLIAVMLLNTAASLSPTNTSSRSILSIGILFLMMILGAIVTRTPHTKGQLEDFSYHKDSQKRKQRKSLESF